MSIRHIPVPSTYL